MAVDEFGIEVTPYGGDMPKNQAGSTVDEFGIEVTPYGKGAQDRQANQADTFTPRERRSFTGELLKGGADVLGGLSRITSPSDFFIPDTTKPKVAGSDLPVIGPTVQAVADLMRTGAGQTLGGVLQAANSWMFGLGDPSAALGDVTEKVTGSKTAGDIASIGGDLAQAIALGKIGKSESFKRFAAHPTWKSKRALAEGWTGDLAAEQARTEGRLAAIEAGTNAGQGDARILAEQARAQTRAGAQAKINAAKQTAEADLAQLPTAQELKTRFAPDAPLGKKSGEAFQAGFNAKWDEAKQTFEELYGPLKTEGAAIPTGAENYQAAGGQLKEAAGITGTPANQAERIAGRIPNIAESTDAMEAKVLQQLAEAGPGKRGDVLKNIMAEGEVPAKNATVNDLMNERQRLGAVYRASKDDNARRQLTDMISAIDKDIAQSAPGLADRYSAVNELYKKDYVPYFSKGSPTRSIASGSPEQVVDMIYRPTVSSTGKTAKNNAVESMTRARELITDPAQWEKVNKSFINRGIEQSFGENGFNPTKAREWWNSYKDASGTGNEVLRKGLGEAQFKDIDAVFSQLGNSKRRTIKETLKTATKNAGSEATAAMKDINESSRVLQGERKAQGSRLMKNEKERFDTVSEELQKRITKVLGVQATFPKKLESIGSGVFVSGVMRANYTTMLRGMGIAFGAPALGALMASMKGRNIFKALVRAAPGTAEGLAAVKATQAFLDKVKE